MTTYERIVVRLLILIAKGVAATCRGSTGTLIKQIREIEDNVYAAERGGACETVNYVTKEYRRPAKILSTITGNSGKAIYHQGYVDLDGEKEPVIWDLAFKAMYPAGPGKEIYDLVEADQVEDGEAEREDSR